MLREPASPYLAFLEAVLFLGGWDDFESNGSLGLGLRGEGTEACLLAGLTPHELQSPFPVLRTDGHTEWKSDSWPSSLQPTLLGWHPKLTKAKLKNQTSVFPQDTGRS